MELRMSKTQMILKTTINNNVLLSLLLQFENVPQSLLLTCFKLFLSDAQMLFFNHPHRRGLVLAGVTSSARIIIIGNQIILKV
jgi:hypothetical protein